MPSPPPLDEEVRSAIDDYVGADVFGGEAVRQAALPAIVGELDRRAAQLLDVVVYLERPLSDPSAPQARRQAILLLAECLRGASGLSLNFKHAETLARFFASKLCDWQCVEGALRGIQVLLSRHGPLLRGLKGGDAGEEAVVTHLARRLFAEVSPPSHTQQIRKLVLDVVQQLLQDWHEEVAALGPELGQGVCGTIEEERDPRNLMLSFAIARQLLGEFDGSCVSEEALRALFETLTSYFPITFQPPKDDKYGITGDHLRAALRRAASSTTRLAGLLVPFLLDNARDIAVGDNEDAVAQALEMLPACLEAYGPGVARAHLREVLATARDQICRTTTPCPSEFCSAVRRTLAVAFRDVPAGLQPHWLGRDVDPALRALVADAARGGEALASSGARRLLLAAASAHPALLQRVWVLALPALTAPDDGPAGAAATAATGAEGPPPPAAALPTEAVHFVADLAQLAEAPPGKRPLLAARQVKPGLAAALGALLALRPSGDGESQAARTCFLLVGRLCCLVGEEGSADAFRALSLLLVRPVNSSWSKDWEDWAGEWQQAFLAATAEDSRFEALVGAVGGVLLAQPLRAADLAPMLLASGAESAAPPLLSALPRLLASAALSLARGAAAGGDMAGETAHQLLDRASLLAVPPGTGATAASHVRSGESLAALAGALEAAPPSDDAASWAASRLAGALGLPAELPRLCSGPDGASVGARSLVSVLSCRLPPHEGVALRRQVLLFAVGPTPDSQACVSLVPAVLMAAAQEDWPLCERALSSICRRAPEERGGPGESAALEALQAFVEACPAAELEALLRSIRSALGELLGGDGGAGSGAELCAARWAARCWAAAAAALLRRGGCASQAAGFLGALLGALEGGDAMVHQVPLAFRVLVPPRFDSQGGAGAGAGPGLPPLALQQLSLTMLPSLVARARAEAEAAPAPARRAALESAVMLLCALPAEAACTDCGDELRWCTLVGMSRLREDAEQGGGAGPSADHASVFAAQVVQLLVRAASHGAAWIEDELHSVVSFLAGTGAAHRVPLVRVGSMQALLRLVQDSRGHLAPFRRQVDAATRRGVEDRRREVRLVAVACLNAWHCGGAAAES